jgi:hypothetical protein
MNRSDERKQTGAGLARSPAAARKDEESHARGHDSREHDDKIGGEDTEGSAMARSPGRARADQSKAQSEQKHAGRGDHEVSGGRGIMHETVEADHVIGEGGRVGVKSAEGESDMASAKANRKEADEPEREMNEKAAMGREKSVPAKNVMGHGERETKACHTI